MKRVDVYQALWGMIDIPSKDKPWSMAENIEQIKNAGFDGILQFIEDDSEETQSITQIIQDARLKLGISCFCYDLTDIQKKITYAKKHEAQFINIMVKDYFIINKEAISLLDNIIEIGSKVGIPTYIETHRGTITQDLIRTIEYLEAMPNMRLTLDLSHYIVSGEIETPSEVIELYFNELLKRTASIHIRISNGEQVQVPIDSLNEQQYSNYIRWWQKAVSYASQRDTNRKSFPVIVELGPEPYQQKFLNDQGEYILDCNRWEEAILWKERIKEFLG